VDSFPERTVDTAAAKQMADTVTEKRRRRLDMTSSQDENVRLPLTLRVMSYNIRHGLGMDEQVDLDRVGAVLARYAPDLVALQEVDCRVPRSGNVDQAAELGRITNMRARFGAAMPLDGGEYGNAVLSRFPVVRVENHALPHSERREPRTALVCWVAPAPGVEVAFGSTHLDYLEDPTDRLLQAREIDRWLSGREDPAILAGDFNAPWGDASLRALAEHWLDTAGGNHEPSFPADVPEIRIDHVLAGPPDRWRVKDFRVVEESLASDHRPVLATLELMV